MLFGKELHRRFNARGFSAEAFHPGGVATGRAIALELGSRSVHVVVASRSFDAGRAVALEIAEAGGSATAFACDVAKVDDVNALVESTTSSLGRIDILVDNAGVIEPIAMIGEADPAAWRRAFDVNVIGAFHVIRRWCRTWWRREKVSSSTSAPGPLTRPWRAGVPTARRRLRWRC